MDPVGALLGWVLLGAGVVVLFGAIKNKRVWGAKGIIPTALTTGSLADLKQVPAAYATELDISTIGDAVTDATDAGAAFVSVRAAVLSIAQKDTSLAEEITRQLNKIDNDTTRSDLTPLAQLLTLADGYGKKKEADVVRLYVKGRTDESI